MTENIWEPLAEIEFNVRGQEKTRAYCLCSRAFIRSRVQEDNPEVHQEALQHYEIIKEGKISVSDPDSHLAELHNFKKQEVESLSCYCSASHYSTDDYESVIQSTSEQPTINEDQLLPCPLQNSDSGADLSENFIEKPCCVLAENAEFKWQYSKPRVEAAWEKYWSENGESIIWKSWIEKYGAYINPSYLDQSSFCENLDTEENNLNIEEFVNSNELEEASCTNYKMKDREKEENYTNSPENLPLLKISSYPSCGNLSDTESKFIDESDAEEKIIKSNSFGSYTSYEKVKCNVDEKRLGDHERVRSRCSNTNLSIRSIANTTVTTDSMTNVTKITLSSLDLSCEECESVKSTSLLSSCSDNSSGPSSTASSSSNQENCTEADVWWRKVWKEHYEDQYAGSYQIFVQNFDQCNKGQVSKVTEGLLVKETKHETWNDLEKNNIFKSQQYFNSVSYILSKLEKTNLCADEKREESEKGEDDKTMATLNPNTDRGGSLKRPPENSEDSLDEPEGVDANGKRFTHHGETDKSQKKGKSIKKMDNVKQAMSLMGFSFNADCPDMQSGSVRYRKRNIRGQNRRLKLCDTKPRTHLIFDDDGNPSDVCQNKAPDETCQSFAEQQEENHNKLENIVEPESLGYEAHSSSIEDAEDVVDESKKQKKKRKKQRKYCLPQEIVDNKALYKYWRRRYQLFSKFDNGVKLDAESWYSVTPEPLAKHHAERCRCDLILDAFCGAGGNSIQFAFTCERGFDGVLLCKKIGLLKTQATYWFSQPEVLCIVAGWSVFLCPLGLGFETSLPFSPVIAIDIDPAKIAMAKNNAKIYGVEDRIEFIIGDFVTLASSLQADVVFLSPPWGGPDYSNQNVYCLNYILPPFGGRNLYQIATAVTDEIAYFLPKNADSTEIALLPAPSRGVEIEQNFLDRRLCSVTAYFGELITNPNDSYPDDS